MVSLKSLVLDCLISIFDPVVHVAHQGLELLSLGKFLVALQQFRQKLFLFFVQKRKVFNRLLRQFQKDAFLDESLL